MAIWTALVSPVTGLLGKVIEGKQKKQEAKDQRAATKITNEANWDEIQAHNASKSWKDEWLTLLVSIPLIMAFIPGLAPYVAAGFTVLANTPAWYQGLVSLVFAAAFGVKQVSNIMTRNSINRQQEMYSHKKMEAKFKEK